MSETGKAPEATDIKKVITAAGPLRIGERVMITTVGFGDMAELVRLVDTITKCRLRCEVTKRGDSSLYVYAVRRRES